MLIFTVKSSLIYCDLDTIIMTLSHTTLTLTYSGPGHVLGFHQSATGDDSPGVLPVLGPRDTQRIQVHERLWQPYVQTREQGQSGCLLQISLEGLIVLTLDGLEFFVNLSHLIFNSFAFLTSLKMFWGQLYRIQKFFS